MVQSLQLGTNGSADTQGMKRLNRVPLFLGIGIAVVFLAVLVYGLSSRGLRFGHDLPNEAGPMKTPSTPSTARILSRSSIAARVSACTSRQTLAEALSA